MLTRAFRGGYSIIVMLHNKPSPKPMPYGSKCWFLPLPPAFGVWLISARLCWVWLLHVSLLLLDLMLGIWVETIAFLHWHRAFSSHLFSFLTCKRERIHGKKIIIHAKEETSLEASQWRRLFSPNAGGPSLIHGQGTRSHMLQLKSSHATIKTVVMKTWHS